MPCVRIFLPCPIRSFHISNPLVEVYAYRLHVHLRPRVAVCSLDVIYEDDIGEAVVAKLLVNIEAGVADVYDDDISVMLAEIRNKRVAE